jgi:hypothetical protein
VARPRPSPAQDEGTTTYPIGRLRAVWLKSGMAPLQRHAGLTTRQVVDRGNGTTGSARSCWSRPEARIPHVAGGPVTEMREQRCDRGAVVTLQ